MFIRGFGNRTKRKEKVMFSKGESIVQGIFLKYLTTENNENRNIERTSSY